jgi:DNA topoisomerase-3
VELPPEEIIRLVNEGATNLIEGMISKRNTKFKARLALTKGGDKFEFDFPPRETE